MYGQVPWVLLENVVGLLDRVNGAPPAMDYVVTQLEGLGYRWAYRVVNTVSSPIIILLLLLEDDPRMGGQLRKTPRWAAGGTGPSRPWGKNVICIVR